MSRIGTYSATPMQREQRDPDEEVENQAPEGSSQVGGGYMFDSPHTAEGYNQGAKSSLPFNAFQGEINPNVVNFMETHGGALQGALGSLSGGSTPPPPGESTDRTALGEIDEREARFNEMLAELEGKSYGLMNNRMADSNARAGVIAGRMGSSVGGGYGGAMAQQQLDNLRALDQHQLDWGSMSLDAHQKYGDQTVSELQRMDTQANDNRFRESADTRANAAARQGVLEFALEHGLDPEMALQSYESGDWAAVIEASKQGQDTYDKLVNDMSKELGFNPDDLTDHQRNLLEKASKGDEAALEEFKESVGESKVDAEFDSRKSTAERNFIKAMKDLGVKDINNTSDTQAKLVYQMFQNAQTPEQLDAAVERAKAWRKAKAARKALKTTPNSKQAKQIIDDYNAKYGENVGYK